MRLRERGARLRTGFPRASRGCRSRITRAPASTHPFSQPRRAATVCAVSGGPTCTRPPSACCHLSERCISAASCIYYCMQGVHRTAFSGGIEMTADAVALRQAHCHFDLSPPRRCRRGNPAVRRHRRYRPPSGGSVPPCMQCTCMRQSHLTRFSVLIFNCNYLASRIQVLIPLQPCGACVWDIKRIPPLTASAQQVQSRKWWSRAATRRLATETSTGDDTCISAGTRHSGGPT